MTPPRAFITAVIAIALLPACNGGKTDNTAIPRRTAYPRIDIPDADYVATDAAPIHFETAVTADVRTVTPSSADVAAHGSAWIDIAYPGYGVTLHCTFSQTTPEHIPGILDNRIERLSVNTGGATSELSELINPDGFECRMIVTRADSPTPVQFIATDHDRWVVSGSAYIEAGRNANPDSIAPVIAMLERDIMHTLTTMRR